MNVTSYDFKKPRRLPTEWLHRLTRWHQAACALANCAWAKQLPAGITVSIGALDTVYAQKGLSSLPTNVIGYRVLIAGGKLPSLLVLPRLLILQLVGILLGDAGTATEDRELTLVEENLADYFLVQLWLPFFRESWPGPALVSWELGEREANPQGSRFFAADDVLLTLPWQLHGPWGVSECAWYFQKSGILETLGNGQTPLQETLDDKTAATRKQALVNSLPLQLEFVLGTTEVRLSELSRLQVGDVIMLDQRHDDGVIAGTGTHHLFRGRAGRVGSWKAFQIDGQVNRGEG
jgi:flagellar motor switch protein FliM